MALARSMLISDFCETCYVKPSYRIIIDHINHIPHGRDAADSNPPKWNLFWGRRSFVWNNEGDTATIFDPVGNKVDSLQVVTLKTT